MERSEAPGLPFGTRPKVARWIAAALLLLLIVLHFHDANNFRRPLLDYDDTEFIAPLDGMSLSTYFGAWATTPEHYVFPLRDLTFAIDFNLSRWLHFQTFWLVDLLLFALTLVVIGRIFALYYRARPLLVVAAVGLLALHPVNVHMVEWLSNRKHLLVVLILGWATSRALEQDLAKVAPSGRDWIIYFSAYVAAWLCFPSGMLWIFWVIALFHASLRRHKLRAALIVSLACIVAGAGYHLTVAANTSYQTSHGIDARAASFAVASTGRAVWNLIFPVALQPYYRLHDERVNIGLVLLAIGLAIVAWRLVKLPKERRRLFFLQALLAVALYLPHAKVFLGYSEYVWSDRYMYGPLPFLVLSAMLVFVDPARPETRLTARTGLATIMALFTAGAFYLCDWRLVPKWQDGRELFETCARQEESPKCVAMAVEKTFDRGGCALVGHLLEQSHRIAATADDQMDHSFQAEVPVYDGLCVAAESRPTAEKLSELATLRSVYRMNEFVVLAEILVRLQERDLPSALALANATYFNPTLPIPNASSKVINMMRGQGEALCQIVALLSQDQSCWTSLEVFGQRTAKIAWKSKQTEWTFARTLAAFNTGS